MKRTPTLVRVVQVDYLAQLFALLPLVLWAMSLVATFVNPEDARFFRTLALPATLVGLGLVFWRFRLISGTYEDGTKVEGTVTGIGFFRGRGRLHYVYTAQGQKLMGSNAINATAVTRGLAPGQTVSVTYSPYKPRRSFVDELYL